MACTLYSLIFIVSAYQPTVTVALKSLSHNRLAVPTKLTKTFLASRAFQNYAPKIWNDLPKHLHDLVRIYGVT